MFKYKAVIVPGMIFGGNKEKDVRVREIKAGLQ